MTEQQSNGTRRRTWVYPIALLGGVTLGWFVVLLALDQLVGPARQQAIWSLLTEYKAADVQAALGNLPEVVVAVLGIAITVVSIILQLSATRYTPRVTEMFFRDSTNLIVLGFFVVTSLHCIWATFVVHPGYVPHLLIAVTLVMMTASILLLVPYFIYVFAFLDPERVVTRIQLHSLSEAVSSSGGSIELRQDRVLQGIEQLADVAINSVSNKDRIIASRTVDALRDLSVSYLDKKDQLEPQWFVVDKVLLRNPDFTVMARPSVEAISSGRTWLEFKVMRQYRTIFGECLNRMRDISQLVAINTRYLGEAAIKAQASEVVGLAIKFFNTYLRATINAADVRTAYNVLHQYRQLAEALLRARWRSESVDLARYFEYYGQTANARGLSFITETAAYDLCALCELAHEIASPEEECLLDTFLEVDKVPETESEERSLRGVRKAQVKLATYYLHVGAEELARRIFKDMEHERPERLVSIREELLSVTDKDFWEIIDRGHNFDYLEADRRLQLERFYSWFASDAVRTE